MLGAILLSLATLGADAPADAVPEGLAERAWTVTDAVLAHHVSPPARQQMILDGFQALYRAARLPVPSDLARKASRVTTVQGFQALLDEQWALRRAEDGDAGSRKPERVANREDVFTTGLLASVDGRARFIAAKDLKVEQQLAANRYVGLQIALSFNRDVNRPQIAEVLAGGPADRAGVLRGDLIEEVDGKTTEGEELRSVVDRLRGAEGTDVIIRVRKGKAASRTYTITRGVLPRKTIEDVRCFGGADGQRLVDGTGLISYLRFKEIAGSTPQELRQLARTLEDHGGKALVLDFRGMSEARFHPAVLLADELLESGVIGRLRMAARVETYRAEPDALFRGWPLAVVVDAASSGVTTWLAAALKDNHRAFVVGTPLIRVGGAPNDFAGVESALPLGDSRTFIELMTGQLERADGRLLGPMLLAQNLGSGRRAGGDPVFDRSFIPDVAIPASRLNRSGRGTAAPGRFDGDTATSAAHNRLRAQLGLPPADPTPHNAQRVTHDDEVRR